MRAKSFAGMACSIAGALEAIGDRWAFLIIRDLTLGLTRYDQIQTSTGMPPTTLSARLRHLEAAGIIERRQYSSHPARVDYVLTGKGRELWPVLFALAQWGDRWDASGRGMPPVDFVDTDTGRKLKLSLIDARTGTPVPPTQLRPRPGRGADNLVRWRIEQGKRRPQQGKRSGISRKKQP
jgi:DNA-binding HxlR family transcriptional regulator